MSLYPEKPQEVDPKFGRTFPAGYIPKELDDEGYATTRAVMALDDGWSREQAIGFCLNGSDEVIKATQIVDLLLAEKKVLDAIPYQDLDVDYEDEVYAKTSLLDPAIWMERKLAAEGVEDAKVVIEDIESEDMIDVPDEPVDEEPEDEEIPDIFEGLE